MPLLLDISINLTLTSSSRGADSTVYFEDKSKKDLSLQSNNLDSKLSPRSSTLVLHRRAFDNSPLNHHANSSPDPPPASKQLPDTDEGTANKVASHADTTQPLAPPPRPAPSQQNPTDTPDYFSSDHNPSHFSLEPNPFEQSFGNPSTEGPGKSLLPPVAAITSPAPLNGGAASAGGYNWTNSLRSGPLSPAMLNEPTGSGGYFDSHLRGGFPTPNESSLRTGLTPGGGGSMFPAPSPNSQALYQQLASGGATPSTLDFHRTAMTAAAARKPGNLNNMTSQPQEKRAPVAPMDHTSQQQTQQQPFGQHDNDAANGLFLLAQAGNGTQSNNQFAIPNPPEMSHGLPDAMQGRAQEASPNFAKRATRNANGSMGGSMSGSARDMSEMSGDMSEIGEQIKPNTRAKGKRSSSGKGVGATNGRRKAEEPPSKQSSAKRAKTSKASAEMDMSMGMDGMDSEEEPNIKEEQYHENGKKMTDEEKRKNFLERNRY